MEQDNFFPAKREWETEEEYRKRISPYIQKPKNNKVQGQPAPILQWQGDKWDYGGSYDKNERPSGKYFYMLPIPLMKYIWSTLNGKSGLKCRIMEVLIGTQEGFNISEKWICEIIGVDASSTNSMASYRKARKELCDMGWLKYDSAAHTLIICYDFLWKQTYENTVS